MSPSERINAIDIVVAAECGVHPAWMHQANNKREVVLSRRLAQLFCNYYGLNPAQIAVNYHKSKSSVGKALSSISFLAQNDVHIRETALRICFKLEIPSDKFMRFCRMTP